MFQASIKKRLTSKINVSQPRVDDENATASLIIHKDETNEIRILKKCIRLLYESIKFSRVLTIESESSPLVLNALELFINMSTARQLYQQIGFSDEVPNLLSTMANEFPIDMRPPNDIYASHLQNLQEIEFIHDACEYLMYLEMQMLAHFLYETKEVRNLNYTYTNTYIDPICKRKLPIYMRWDILNSF